MAKRNPERKHWSDSIESMIDASSVEFVLDMISVICDEKAEHILSSYDDRPLAKAWEKAGKAISKAAQSIEV